MKFAPATTALLLAATLLGIGAPAQMRVEVGLPPSGAVFGHRFEVTVRRTWPRDHEPQPFDGALLAPLDLRQVELSMTVVGAEFVERRRFEAVAFEVGEIAFAPFVVRTRDPSGREHATEVATPPLAVRTSLSEPPGGVEWPGDVRDAPASPIWGIVTAALLGTAAGLWLLRPRRRTPEVPVAPAGPTAAELARAEIDGLAMPGPDRERLEAYYLGLAEIVRRFAMRQFGVRAFVHTSEQLIAVVPVGGDPLRQCLFACDLVKFAADRPPPDADIDARARALAFVSSAAADPDRDDHLAEGAA